MIVRRRHRCLLPKLSLVAALCLNLLGESAHGQTENSPNTPEQAVELRDDCIDPQTGAVVSIPEIQALILMGRLDQASRALDCVVITSETEIDVPFLRGRIAEARRDFPTAIAEYRRILAKRPELTRVRLELARLLFVIKEDTASRHHFELALGADLPPTVRDNVLRFLAAIRRRQRVHAEFSLGVVPDSNINTATEQSEITLFGLPFRLSDDARRESGVGISVEGFLGFRQPLTNHYGLETGVSARRIEHAGGNFDDTKINAFIGLRRAYSKLDVGVRTIFSHQWFGNQPINQAVGGELDVGGRLLPRLETRVFAGGEVRKYDEAKFLDGYLVSLRGIARYSLSPKSLLDTVLGIAREETDDPGYTNTQPFVGARYLKAFPTGVSVALGPLMGLRDFDEPIAAFGKTRRDVIFRFEVEVVVNRPVAYGFAPVFSYSYTYNQSNIDLFEYRRHFFEVGLTKRF